MKSYPVQVIFREYFEGILAACFLALFLRFFVVSVLFMPTDSMEPSLIKGDFVVGWRLSFGLPLPLMKGERLNFKPPKRGDLISFRFPGDEEQLIVRRVVGLPGEKISILAGKVIINGKPMVYEEIAEEGTWRESVIGEASYEIKSLAPNDMPEVTVPQDQYFVLSDKRSHLDDSRDWGFIPNASIESRLGFRWLSLENGADGVRIRWDRLFSFVD
ncbi:MAG: signal peptidase I [Pseudomonadota bacterium]